MKLTVESHRRHQHETGEFLRVFLDGKDVTDGCVEADNEEGRVVQYCRRDGEFYVDPASREVARETLRGTVEFRPGQPSHQ